MNNTNLPVSLEDTTELRKLIIENPDLPLIVFRGDNSWHLWHPMVSYPSARIVRYM